MHESSSQVGAFAFKARLPARIFVAGRDLHIAMLDDVPPVHDARKVTGKGGGKTGNTGKTVGKGQGKFGKPGSNKRNTQCAIKDCAGYLSKKRNTRFLALHSEDQKSGRPKSQYNVPICGTCMTTGVENGKVVSLNSGGSPDFGPLKAAFGPNGDKHSSNMTKNGILAYDEMCVDAPESANVAVVSADAGDDEDDVISLSSKASAESRSHSSESSDTEARWPEYGPAPCTNYTNTSFDQKKRRRNAVYDGSLCRPDSENWHQVYPKQQFQQYWNGDWQGPSAEQSAPPAAQLPTDGRMTQGYCDSAPNGGYIQ